MPQPISIQLLDQIRKGVTVTYGVDRPPARVQGFYAKYGKRILDILASTAGLILLSPLLAIIACRVKWTSRGPVCYRQVRVGKDGRPFRIVKFRSMVAHASGNDSAITVAGDLRVTAVGSFLRRYKLDELPQLWNVLRGEMSLVGPRPEVPFYVADYTPDQRAVLSARPGITDPATLVYRHEEQILAAQDDPENFYRTRVLPDKLARNSVYLQDITFTNDFRIILKTISSSLWPVEKEERDTRSG